MTTKNTNEVLLTEAEIENIYDRIQELDNLSDSQSGIEFVRTRAEISKLNKIVDSLPF